MYPSDQFEYLHVQLKFQTVNPYTRRELKSHIKSYTSWNSTKTTDRNRLIDDIYINEIPSNRLLWCTGNISCRIKFRSLKRDSIFPITQYIVPRELGLVQRFRKEKSWLTILDISNKNSNMVYIEDTWMHEINTLNIGLWDILDALKENTTHDIDELLRQVQKNDVVSGIVNKVLDTYIGIYNNWISKNWSFRVLLQGNILHYPYIVQYFVKKLSERSNQYVGLYTWSDFVMPGRDWSSDEIYVVSTIDCMRWESLLTSFSTPTA